MDTDETQITEGANRNLLSILSVPRLLKLLSTASFLFVIASCHPAGCYGPKSFGYNTTGIVTSNLFGVYVLDSDQASILDAAGFTNHSGSIELKQDMKFQFTNVPCIMCFPTEKGVYASVTGGWCVAKENAVWVLKLYSTEYQNMCCRYGSFTLRVLGELSPHGIELAINHDTGMWVKLKKAASSLK